MTDRLWPRRRCLSRQRRGWQRVELAASLDRVSAREAELEEQLDAAQATIAQMRASGRKTAGAGVSTMVAKEGAAFEVGGLDAALGCLSVEQRIAVKAGLMRSGLVG